MKSAVENMLEKYGCVTTDDCRNALKEIVQEIALLGLYRADFFSKAAFYGGSALRIFYGLNRFSEDLDFSLSAPDPGFDISDYCDAVKNELGAFGFEMEVDKKPKSFDSNIESAFIKGGTKVQIMNIFPAIPSLEKIHRNEKLKIKLEVDTNPPPGAGFEVRYHLSPVPFSVRLYDTPSLFSGKLHAVLCRNWGGGRSKGRDLYDLVWYFSKKTKPNLTHLTERMKQTGQLSADVTLTTDILKKMLKDKYDEIDFRSARRDVESFLKDIRDLELWSKEFFTSITEDNL